MDLTHAPIHEKHDTVNSVLGGVDFQIIEPTEQLWLELKSWRLDRFAPRQRGGQRRSYLCKMRNRKFAQDLREKFLGTCTFLTLTGSPPNTPIIYVLLLESAPSDRALRLHMMTRMRGLLPPNGARIRPWAHPVQVAVVDVAEWNLRYPNYPATLAP